MFLGMPIPPILAEPAIFIDFRLLGCRREPIGHLPAVAFGKERARSRQAVMQNRAFQVAPRLGCIIVIVLPEQAP